MPYQRHLLDVPNLRHLLGHARQALAAELPHHYDRTLAGCCTHGLQLPQWHHTCQNTCIGQCAENSRVCTTMMYTANPNTGGTPLWRLLDSGAGLTEHMKQDCNRCKKHQGSALQCSQLTPDMSKLDKQYAAYNDSYHPYVANTVCYKQCSTGQSQQASALW